MCNIFMGETGNRTRTNRQSKSGTSLCQNVFCRLSHKHPSSLTLFSCAIFVCLFSSRICHQNHASVNLLLFFRRSRRIERRIDGVLCGFRPFAQIAGQTVHKVHRILDARVVVMLEQERRLAGGRQLRHVERQLGPQFGHRRRRIAGQLFVQTRRVATVAPHVVLVRPVDGRSGDAGFDGETVCEGMRERNRSVGCWTPWGKLGQRIRVVFRWFLVYCIVHYVNAGCFYSVYIQTGWFV